MNTTYLRIRFFVKENKKNKKGDAPIKCRITYLGIRKEIATGISVQPHFWDKIHQKLLDDSPDSQIMNMRLSLVKNKIDKAFLMLQIQEKEFDVNDVYNLFVGESPKGSKGIIEIFALHNERTLQLVGKEIVMRTYKRYELAKNHVSDFIRWKFKTSDVAVRRLKLSFITDLEHYLKTEKNMQQITLNKAIQRLRRVIKYAIGNDYLDKDPFILYKVKRVKKEIVFLNPEELKRLEEKEMPVKRLQIIKDCFIFCCYSGLAFHEMGSLKLSHIEKGMDGFNWIKMKRKKTGKSMSIPILPKAQQIIEQYRSEDRDKVFPLISNQNFNAFLKEIAIIARIDKNLTHHMARKTFASTVLLFNDVPMEIVSELLGHSSMVVTQESYGKVVNRKVSDAMNKLRRRI